MDESPAPQLWPTAPTDGSVVRAEFKDGTQAKARWVAAEKKWKILLENGHWRSMDFFHGLNNPPQMWWPPAER